MDSSTPIFVMPKEYRDGQTSLKWHKPEEEKKAVVSKSQTPLPISKSVKRVPKTTRLFLIVGVIFVFSLTLVAILLISFSSTSEQKSTSLEKPILTSKEPEQVVSPTPPPIPVPVVESQKEKDTSSIKNPFASGIWMGIDSDNDGLTDIEETLYGTNNRLPDTDQDGFLDGNEVFHGYHPNIEAPMTLDQAGFLEVGTFASWASFSYPKAWRIQESDNPGEILLKTTTGEAVIISLKEKNESETLEDWLKQHKPDSKEVVVSETKKGLSYAFFAKEMYGVIDLGKGIILIDYEPGSEKKSMEYGQTIQMMINSIDPILVSSL